MARMLGPCVLPAGPESKVAVARSPKLLLAALQSLLLVTITTPSSAQLRSPN